MVEGVGWRGVGMNWEPEVRGRPSQCSGESGRELDGAGR